MKVFYDGREWLLSDLCKNKEISYSLVYSRLKRGISITEALSKDRLNGNSKVKSTWKDKRRFGFYYNGMAYESVEEYCEKNNAVPGHIYNLMHRYGLSPVEAIKTDKKNKIAGQKNKKIDIIYKGKAYSSARQFCMENSKNPKSAVVYFSKLKADGIPMNEILERVANK